MKCGAVLFAGLLLSQAAVPAIYRLDDSASPRSRVPAQVVLAEDGRPLANAIFARAAFVKFGRVDYRLSTARYIGQSARIYFVVPANVQGLRSPAGLRVEWRGLGRFASGSARPGDRHLIWSGTIAEPMMSESLDLLAQVDLQEVRFPADGRFGFECYFEIETSP